MSLLAPVSFGMFEGKKHEFYHTAGSSAFLCYLGLKNHPSVSSLEIGIQKPVLEYKKSQWSSM